MRANTAIGVLVWAILNSRGKTQSWLAEETGLSVSYLTLLLSDQRPLLPHLEEKLRKALGLRKSVDLNEAARQLLELLRGLEEQPPP